MRQIERAPFWLKAGAILQAPRAYICIVTDLSLIQNASPSERGPDRAREIRIARAIVRRGKV